MGDINNVLESLTRAIRDGEPLEPVKESKGCLLLFLLPLALFAFALAA